MPNLPEFTVRITVDETLTIRALTEDEASDLAWEQILNEGAWGQEITELEEDDGVS